jgi:isoquinoline 1-oxidoreductase beta subunit
MTDFGASDAGVSRRSFLQWGAFSGAALILGVYPNRVVSAGVLARRRSAFMPNQWLRIDETGLVTIVAAHSEMGQGIRTALPMIVADELGADWARVTVVHAEPGPLFTQMRTSGSGGVSDSWRALRIAGATARAMLISVAATEWSVEPGSCVSEAHAIVHRESGRRIAFGALVGRASALAVPPPPILKVPTGLRIVGTRVPRVDGPKLVNGSATFGLDVRPRGFAVAVIARPPQHGAAVQRWSDGQARAIPGVISVVQVPTGIAVIADRTWTAMRARDALELEWQEPSSLELNSTEHRRLLDAAVDHGRKSRREGNDVGTLIAAAARTMQATYTTPWQGHAAMEPLNCVADVRDGRCEIWVGTQAPNQAQERAAALLGIPVERVTIHVTLLGGGFGRRLDIDYVLEAVEVSRAARMPVQVVWTREDDTRHDRYQPGQVNKMTAALDAAGHPIGWRHQVADYHLTMFGPYNSKYDPAADEDPWGGYDTPYAFPGLDVTLAMLESPVPSGAWRAVGYPSTVFARESFLDEIAHATHRDPVQLRLDLVPSPGNVKRGSLVIPNGDRLRWAIRTAAEKAGWATPLAKTTDGRRWARGFACNSYADQTMVAQVAEVSVGRAGDVRVHRIVCAVDCGLAINPLGIEGQFESGIVWGLSAALKGQITFTRGRTDQSNFRDYPVLRMNESPVVEVHIAPSTLPPYGIGEPPVPPVAPAVLNAVFAATGQRIRELPVRAAALKE